MLRDVVANITEIKKCDEVDLLYIYDINSTDGYLV